MAISATWGSFLKKNITKAYTPKKKKKKKRNVKPEKTKLINVYNFLY